MRAPASSAGEVDSGVKAEGGPHEGVLIAVALVLSRRAAPSVVAAVNAGCQIAPLGSRLCSPLHLVHVAACKASLAS